MFRFCGNLSVWHIREAQVVLRDGMGFRVTGCEGEGALLAGAQKESGAHGDLTALRCWCSSCQSVRSVLVATHSCHECHQKLSQDMSSVETKPCSKGEHAGEKGK